MEKYSSYVDKKSTQTMQEGSSDLHLVIQQITSLFTNKIEVLIVSVLDEPSQMWILKQGKETNCRTNLKVITGI